jgi:hypothetical protein
MLLKDITLTPLQDMTVRISMHTEEEVNFAHYHIRVTKNFIAEMACTHKSDADNCDELRRGTYWENEEHYMSDINIELI